jgi:hypothetical protein
MMILYRRCCILDHCITFFVCIIPAFQSVALSWMIPILLRPNVFQTINNILQNESVHQKFDKQRSCGKSYILNFSKRSDHYHDTSETNESDILKTIDNHMLLSVDSCINLYNQYQTFGKDMRSKLVFIDASWFHKGNLNGREM